MASPESLSSNPDGSQESTPKQREGPSLILKTEEVNVPEEMREKGYWGKMHIEVYRVDDLYKIYRKVTGQKEGLGFEPTVHEVATEEEARQRAQALLHDWEGLVND